MSKSKDHEQVGQALSGRSSDRIRAGKIDADLAFKGNDSNTEPEAKRESIMGAAGYGLGRGATRGRNGGAS